MSVKSRVELCMEVMLKKMIDPQVETWDELAPDTEIVGANVLGGQNNMRLVVQYKQKGEGLVRTFMIHQRDIQEIYPDRGGI